MSGRARDCATCSSSPASTMVKRVVVWCSLVLLQTTVAVQTPPFKPLVPGVGVVLGWLSPPEPQHRLARLLNQWDNLNLTQGITLNRIHEPGDYLESGDSALRNSLLAALLQFVRQHVVRVRLQDVAQAFSDNNDLDATSRSVARFFGGGQNSFMTGFVLGVVAFGLKKLMLPFIIGAQIFKSVLLALFLPSIIGGLGKIVSKQVSNFAAGSAGNGLAGLSGGGGQMEDFDFKDQTGYATQMSDAQADGSSALFSYAYPNSPYDSAATLNKYGDNSNIGVLPAPYPTNSIANRYTMNTPKVSYLTNTNHHGSFYTKNSLKTNKQQDYKVFHNIPSSSLLLTNYDPFYSALLSRMDSVFQQLGYDSEGCRERLVCLMYTNPAKFAPYSNLISAQLSRELNELRKPSTDNPEILRFFKYMKAAKDGQDGADCRRVYPDCYDNRESAHPPMVQTYNDINKLVHARKL